MLTSIDQVAHKLGRLLKKHHDKQTDKHHIHRMSLAKDILADPFDGKEEEFDDVSAGDVENDTSSGSNNYISGVEVRNMSVIFMAAIPNTTTVHLFCT